MPALSAASADVLRHAARAFALLEPDFGAFAVITVSHGHTVLGGMNCGSSPAAHQARLRIFAPHLDFALCMQRSSLHGSVAILCTGYQLSPR